MQGLGTDHKFLYFSVILNIFPCLSQVWGWKCTPAPTPRYIPLVFEPIVLPSDTILGCFLTLLPCLRNFFFWGVGPWVHLHFGGHFEETLWDKSNNPSDIIKFLRFLELFLGMDGCSRMGIFDGKHGIGKNWKTFFQKTFLEYVL